MGFGPATGPTLKTALCHIRALVGRMINDQNICELRYNKCIFFILAFPWTFSKVKFLFK